MELEVDRESAGGVDEQTSEERSTVSTQPKQQLSSRGRCCMVASCWSRHCFASRPRCQISPVQLSVSGSVRGATSSPEPASALDPASHRHVAGCCSDAHRISPSLSSLPRRGHAPPPGRNGRTDGGRARREERVGELEQQRSGGDTPQQEGPFRLPDCRSWIARSLTELQGRPEETCCRTRPKWVSHPFKR
jgi:hypothetical protein